MFLCLSNFTGVPGDGLTGQMDVWMSKNGGYDWNEVRNAVQIISLKLSRRVITSHQIRQAKLSYTNVILIFFFVSLGYLKLGLQDLRKGVPFSYLVFD